MSVVSYGWGRQYGHGAHLLHGPHVGKPTLICLKTNGNGIGIHGELSRTNDSARRRITKCYATNHQDIPYKSGEEVLMFVNSMANHLSNLHRLPQGV